MKLQTRCSFPLTAVAAALSISFVLPASAANYTWASGAFTNTGIPPSLLAADTLFVVPGTPTKLLNVSVSNAGAIVATDMMALANTQTLTNDGLYDLRADVGLGNVLGGTFVNNGSFVKSVGSGTSYVDPTFVNGATGIVEVRTGTIEFRHGDASFASGTQFTGAGTVIVSNSASFSGAFTTANNLRLTGGSLTGVVAQMDGDTSWAGGTMVGDWTVGAGATLTVESGLAKQLSANLNNKGTIAAEGPLGVVNSRTLTNNGVYDLRGDIGIATNLGGSVVNNATLVKSAGTGTSQINATFRNSGSGVIDVSSGTLDFRSGAASFDSGTRFTGAGTVTVSNSSTFNGSFTTAGNLRLTGGSLTGVGAQMDGDTSWAGGAMIGDWTVGAGTTLTVESGFAKSLYAELDNKGTIAANGTVGLGNAHTLTNNGVYDLRGDVAIAGSHFDSFVNNGTLIKSSGNGVSNINVIFSNPASGVVVLDSGTVALAESFANEGTLDFGLSDLGSFGKLALAGATTLGGQVDVHFLGGYLPSVGDSFRLITYGSYSGSFTNASWTFSDGAHLVTFDPIYNSRDFTLSVQSVQAVPEPATIVMFLAGLLTVGSYAQRRLNRES
ncbi:MAG TPA: PEP-CTERM sorting domain-containing protein [Rubrivivax sp.]|nr:PEP-CTERM sorting domain-containing protein [Rubrivivax sp.]